MNPYQIQIICTQLYGIKYSNLILSIYIQLVSSNFFYPITIICLHIGVWFQEFLSYINECNIEKNLSNIENMIVVKYQDFGITKPIRSWSAVKINKLN